VSSQSSLIHWSLKALLGDEVGVRECEMALPMESSSVIDIPPRPPPPPPPGAPAGYYWLKTVAQLCLGNNFDL